MTNVRKLFIFFLSGWTLTIILAFFFNRYALHEYTENIMKSNTESINAKAFELKMLIIYSSVFLLGLLLLSVFHKLSQNCKLNMDKTNRELQDLIVAKNKFINVLAHDLRTPAANIVSLSKTLKYKYNELSETECKNCIDMLEESANTHSELLINLLSLSRSQLGNIQFEPEQLEISKLINTVLAQTKLQAQQKQITQINQVSECFVFADKNMVTTVIRNLVSNAIKFTNSGGKIVINVDETNEKPTISISDSGVGIVEHKKNGIFGLESYKSTTGTANEEGTGLGLLLCKEYIERNHGQIWFESESGIGTTFFFTLPRN